MEVLKMKIITVFPNSDYLLPQDFETVEDAEEYAKFVYEYYEIECDIEDGSSNENDSWRI